MSQTASLAALVYDDGSPAEAEAEARRDLGPTLGEADTRFEAWRANTRVRVVLNDCVVQFAASSRGQARQLFDEAVGLLAEMEGRRARTSHLHPSWPR